MKTKNAISTLSNLKLGEDKVLVVMESQNPIIRKSFSNLPNATVLLANYLNPRELLNHTKIVLVKDSLDIIQKNLAI